MYLLNLKDQRDIVQVIEYLVEIHRKNKTVAHVMEKFHLTADQYRMCCNLAMPALAQGNMKGRFTVVRGINKAMREDIKVLYEAVKDDDGKAAAACAGCTRPIATGSRTWCGAARRTRMNEAGAQGRGDHGAGVGAGVR